MSILLALLLDEFAGEPPSFCHPVVWIGRYLAWTGRRLLPLKPAAAFVAGGLFWLVGAAAVTGGALAVSVFLRQQPPWIDGVVTALLLKPLLSLRLLATEVAAVESALGEGLEAGRLRLARIVSRDTTRLTATEVRESALESLSENLSDSVVAPLFWFMLLGLPGAALYRFANTADAMWGYRGKWEWAGKWAARADDLLNLVPARITALGYLLSSTRRWACCHRLPAEARKTPSPNSGWPMAALALVHGIRLGKPGVYVLNPAGRPPGPAETAACLRRTRAVAWALAFLLDFGSLWFSRLFHE